MKWSSSILLLMCAVVARSAAADLGYLNVTKLNDFGIQTDSGEKPQSKVWTYDGLWWAVMRDDDGTKGAKIWKLGTNGVWAPVLELATNNTFRADTLAAGGTNHILLHEGTTGTGQTTTKLVSVAYDVTNKTYGFWGQWGAGTNSITIALGGAVETATIAMDSQNRMWLASDATNQILVRYSSHPYSSWSAPTVIATNTDADDICVVTAVGTNKIGLLWSDQTSDSFKFRVRNDSDSVTTWSAVEEIADAGGDELADDHLNVASAQDGTLYAAVKTSLNDHGPTGQLQIGLMVRTNTGGWSPVYGIDTSGTRPIVVLNEQAKSLVVAYTQSESGGDIFYKHSYTTNIDFDFKRRLIDSEGYSWNNVTSAKRNFESNIVFLVSSGGGLTARSVLASAATEASSLIAHWKMDQTSGSTILDSSTDNNNGLSYPNNTATIQGSPTWVTGVRSNAISLNGTTDYAVGLNSTNLDVQNQITLAAWIKPSQSGTQRIIHKVNSGDGFSLFLSGLGYVSVRFNNDDNLRVNSSANYPTSGTEWMHVAATYDGATIKLYTNGTNVNSKASTFFIERADKAVSIGATSTGTDRFKGALDDLRIYNRALSAEEVADLAE